MEGINSWIKNWKLNNWKTSAKKDVKNVDLWKKIDELNSLHNIEWKWVKGHSGDFGNEMADNLANLAIMKKGKKNYE
jgi:ribonuclease HI